jgi:hypothetical protein
MDALPAPMRIRFDENIKANMPAALRNNKVMTLRLNIQKPCTTAKRMTISNPFKLTISLLGLQESF